MPQSLARVLVHLVFSTKRREPLLRSDVRPALHGYMAGIFQHWESPAILINSVDDHVHALFGLARIHALAKVIAEVKRGSSKWLKTQDTDLKSFDWQDGYGAFSVSPSSLETVQTYIANQEKHHRRMTFQDEFRELCRRHGVEIDERFVWD